MNQDISLASIETYSVAVTGTKTITGVISQNEIITGVISQKESIVGDLATAYTAHASVYEGDYEITPTVGEQELKTKHKYMNDDIMVHAIPFFEVSNTSGGNTVFIADKLEIE